MTSFTKDGLRIVNQSPLRWFALALSIVIFPATQNCRGQSKSTSVPSAKADNPSQSSEASKVVPASMLQPTPFALPRVTVDGLNTERRSSAEPPRATPVSTTPGSTQPTPAQRSLPTFNSKDVVSGREAVPNATSDLGSLLKKSGSALSVGVQARTPIVSDPRIRGSRVGSLAASGSHWVPARIDLDTVLSKFDSRQIDAVEIIPGPYTTRLGPGFAFTDIQLLQSPRMTSNERWFGGTDFEYRANGNQFLGQQNVMTGGEDWGARFNYALRTGDDYRAGGNRYIPSSYNSGEMTLALGKDWANDSVEFNILRLDQSDVVFPGYVFDMDYLVTDGYDFTHTHLPGSVWDRVDTDVWYNRTRFNGNAQNPAKRPFFPELNQMNYIGFTDVDSMSTGYRQTYTIGGSDVDTYRLQVGHDLRFVKQELNEISSGNAFGVPLPIVNRNSPIPKSFIVNPGIFVEYREELTDRLTFTTGARADYASSDITDDPAKLQEIGLNFIPASYSDIVGTDQYQRSFGLWSFFGTLQQQVTDEQSVAFNCGYSQRPPTLTELYAAQPFMLLLQNGLNNITGDPTLAPEKMLQCDLSWEYRSEPLVTGFRAFQAWSFDYITFENTLVTLVPPAGQVGQVSLRYVNTELATFAGCEWFGDLAPQSPVTPFANVRFVDGRDRTRNGTFATSNGNAVLASRKVEGLPRGAFSGVAAGESEPLPGMPPLETRLGVRYHDTSPSQRWSLEFASRIVNSQDRVATSLLESRTGGFSIFDLRAIFRPSRSDRWIVSTGVENMFDRLYREHLDFRTQSGLSIYQPGANFYLGTSITY